MRQGESRASLRPAAHSPAESPTAIPAAAAARAFEAMCSPGTPSSTRSSPAGVRIVNEARPISSSARSSPRTWASGDIPNRRTDAGVRSAKPRTVGSSAFSTAVPSSARSSTSSALASATAPGEPKNSMCATPTLVTTPTRGRATAVSLRM